VERLLALVCERHPWCRVVRMRQAFVFQRSAAAEQRRLFAGLFVPAPLLAPGRLPVLLYPRGVTFQVVHANDVADAFARAVTSGANGAGNLAAEPVLDRAAVGEIFRARTVDVPVPMMRSAIAASWRAHVVPAEPLLFDAFTRLPTMSHNGHARSSAGSQRSVRPTLSASSCAGSARERPARHLR
jgi:UDP-glucose 4-epimerase